MIPRSSKRSDSRATPGFVLEPSPDRNTVSAAVEPVATIQSGEVVHALTLDAYSGREVTPAAAREPGFFPGKLAVTGPVYVEGALPGGWVGVTIEELDPATVGYLILRHGVGMLGRTWDGPPVPYRFEIAAGMVHNPTLGSFPIRPMIGSISVAPPGDAEVWSGLAGDHVGNIDCPEFGPGATIGLPVYHPGALVYLADGHARMGRGELGGTGIEAGMKVRMRLTVVSGPVHQVNRSTAILAADGWFGVIGMGLGIDAAVEAAIAGLKSWLAHFACDEIEARIALEGEVRICQMVNNLFTAAVGIQPSGALKERLATWQVNG